MVGSVLFQLLILQLSFLHGSIGVRVGHEVGRTSMDSTHYDRRLVQQPCPSDRFQPQVQTALFWTTSGSTKNTSLIPLSNPLIDIREDDSLVTRASGAIDVNIDNPLGIDEALVNIDVDKQITDALSVYIHIIECIGCPYRRLAQDLSPDKSLNLTLNTNYAYRLRVEWPTTKSFCLQELAVREHGQYLVTVRTGSGSSLLCELTVRRAANKVYVPLIVGMILVVVLFFGCIIAKRFNLVDRLTALKNQCLKRRPIQESTRAYNLQPTVAGATAEPSLVKPPTSDEAAPAKPTKTKRLLCLDAFRGFALIAMIFVNYGGGGYAQFEHVPWHGITFADIVFPFFVWMLGTSLVISLKNASDKNIPKRTSVMKIGIRTLKLFIIGFILNTRFKVDLTQVRILGVLQRFSIVYGVVATIEVLCARANQYSVQGSQPSTETPSPVTAMQRARLYLSDIINFPLQWLINIALAIFWILIVYLVPFENCPAGYLGPGGLHENGKYANCTGGITGYIDRLIFSERHLYKYPTCKAVYECGTFDPENLFGALPTMFLAYLGIQAGRILVMYKTDSERLIRLALWSVVTLVIGIGLSGGSLDSGPMPLNKNIWTLSFSFFTAGLAFAGFSIMYVFIDMLKWWDATPFQYPGTNSILIYITHIIFATYFPVQWVVANTHVAHLAMALWGCIFWIIMAYIFFRKRIFLVL